MVGPEDPDQAEQIVNRRDSLPSGDILGSLDITGQACHDSFVNGQDLCPDCNPE